MQFFTQCLVTINSIAITFCGGFRLKLHNDFQYEVNANGSTPAKVMGVDYKATVKPELESYADKIRESSKKKFEDMITLQQQSKEMAIKIEDKKNRIAALQSRIDEVSALKSGSMKVVHNYYCILLLLFGTCHDQHVYTSQDFDLAPTFLSCSKTFVQSHLYEN